MTTCLIDLLQSEFNEDDFEDGMPNLFVQSPYYSYDDALRVLHDKNNEFTILSLNCQSIYSKFDQIQIYIDHYNESGSPFSIICLQETWLSAEHDITLLKLNGYNFVYKPKVASPHGGVAYYIRDTLNFQVKQTLIDDEICDSLFVEIFFSSEDNQRTGRVILGNVYRPPRDIIQNYNNFTTQMERTLSEFRNCANVLIVGDFNIDLLKIDVKDHVNLFLETMLSQGYIPKITLPTRVQYNSKTLIDNCFIKSTNSLSETTSGILLHDISDHFPYFICCNHLLLPKAKSTLVKVHTQTPAAIECFKNELAQTCSMDKFCSDLSDDPNHNYEILNNILISAFDKHIPLKETKYDKYKHKKCKWITKGIINSIKFRDKLYKRVKCIPTTDILYETLTLNLRTYNRILKQMIRTAKKQYFKSVFNKYKYNMKKTWDTIKEVLDSSSSTKFPKYFMINNVRTEDPKQIANKFNEYFVNVGPNLAKEIPILPNLSFINYLNHPCTVNFEFRQIREAEIMKTIEELKSKTSQGLDNLSNKLLKQIKLEIIKPLTLIINQTLNTGIFPDKLKIAKILPIYKKDEEYLLKNYRPISVLSSLSKVFEKVMHKQLFDHFTANTLFFENQYGFRSQHSTEMAALELVDRIICAVDNKKTPATIFLDLSKAFDTLDHDILLFKLKHYGVKGTSLKLMETYLTGRKQVVQFNDKTSDELIIKTGVPQGSILGPLLFIIYLNDLISACEIFKPIIYADDTALLTVLETLITFSSNCSVNDRLNHELGEINKWFMLNKLSLNREKTKAMIFQTRFKRVNEINITIDRTPIEFVDEFKYLGITLDKHLTWKSHINQVSKKVAKTNGILSKLKNTLPTDILKTIYNSLILPYLSYGIMVWGNCSDRLFKLQKRSVRLITNSKYNAHTDPLFKSLSLLKITDIFLLHKYKFIYKLEKQMLPGYFMTSIFIRNNDVHNYNTRHASNLRTPMSRLTLARNSIRYFIPCVYNEMPNCIREKIFTHSFNGFNMYSKLFLIDKYSTTCEIVNCYICRTEH